VHVLEQQDGLDVGGHTVQMLRVERTAVRGVPVVVAVTAEDLERRVERLAARLEPSRERAVELDPAVARRAEAAEREVLRAAPAAADRDA
jgi:hypothetical protein